MDSFREFGGPRSEFLQNFAKYKGNNHASFIEEDCFHCDRKSLFQCNMFMYDGDHTELSHYRALTRFLPLMEETFVFVVDDWNWEGVRNGTRKAIEDMQLETLFEKEVLVDKNDVESFRDKEGWWNGIFVSVLRKQCTI